MDNRLLTPDELKKIKDDWFASLPRGDGKLPKDLQFEAQDTQTRAETLKEVGEYIVKNYLKTGVHMATGYLIGDDFIKALRQRGELPPVG